MNVEVRSVTVWRFASAETLCFEARVVIDGRVAGRVSNAGRGGPHTYRPRDLRDRVDEFAKTQPPITAWGVPVGQTADLVIDELVRAQRTAQDFRRLVAAHVLYQTARGELHRGGRLPRGRVKPAARSLVGRPGVARVLNLLPEEEALAIFTNKVRA